MKTAAGFVAGQAGGGTLIVISIALFVWVLGLLAAPWAIEKLDL